MVLHCVLVDRIPTASARIVPDVRKSVIMLHILLWGKARAMPASRGNTMNIQPSAISLAKRSSGTHCASASECGILLVQDGRLYSSPASVGGSWQLSDSRRWLDHNCDTARLIARSCGQGVIGAPCVYSFPTDRVPPVVRLSQTWFQVLVPLQRGYVHDPRPRDAIPRTF